MPKDFPPWGTVWWYFRRWRREGLWVHIHRALYPLARAEAGRRPGPSVVFMDRQSVEDDGKRGVRGFDGPKRVKGRKRHILVDTSGLLIASLNWIVERTFGWLGRHRRLSKDYEFEVQTSETVIEIAAIRTMLNRLAPA